MRFHIECGSILSETHCHPTAFPLFAAVVTSDALDALLPMDTIFINDLRLNILIGIHEWEKRVPQTIQFNIELAIPPKQGPRTDRIGETIDYSKVVARIEETLRTQHFLLLERLSEHVAQLILSEFGAPWVKVSVNKIGALRNVKQLGVTIERGARG